MGSGVRVAVAGMAGLLVAGAAGASIGLTRLSTDPYTNTSSQHRTEVEPDSFAFGSTIVAAFQVGRFFDGGSSNAGFATSTNGGSSWTNGFLPGTTKYATPAGPYDRVSDPAVAYDARHDVWLVSTLAITESGGVRGVAVITSRSTDGGLSWQNPVVTATGTSPDKNWIVCDNTATSPFYGHCYTEWDDNGVGNRIEMNTSTDGGLTWGSSRTTANNGTGLGGQPLVRPNGTVVVPIASASVSAIQLFTSSDGGASWSATQTIATVTDHNVAGSLRTEPLPSAEIDKKGRIFVFWQDCRFRSGCSSNDIVYLKVSPAGAVSAVKRVPIDRTTTTVDHFTPGIAVDPSTSGSTTRLALTYYFFPVANCGSSCQLHVGFTSSSNSGGSWTVPTDVAGPMAPTWLANTNQGRMYGDYVSTSYVGGSARPAIVVANAPSGSVFDEAAYSSTAGLLAAGGTIPTGNEEPVPGARSDHPPPPAPLAIH